jgi:hypothetical protein
VAAIAPWINETNTELQYASTHTVSENRVQIIIEITYFEK